MDLGAWLFLGGLALAVCAVLTVAPALHRAQLRRYERGAAGGFSGLSSGFDAVWRPSVEDAHADWESAVELPAPAPLAGDRGRIEQGRIVIEVTVEDAARV
jgi:hypothetical protein